MGLTCRKCGTTVQAQDLLRDGGIRLDGDICVCARCAAKGKAGPHYLGAERQEMQWQRKRRRDAFILLWVVHLGLSLFSLMLLPLIVVTGLPLTLPVLYVCHFLGVDIWSHDWLVLLLLVLMTFNSFLATWILRRLLGLLRDKFRKQ